MQMGLGLLLLSVCCCEVHAAVKCMRSFHRLHTAHAPYTASKASARCTRAASPSSLSTLPPAASSSTAVRKAVRGCVLCLA